MIAETNAGFDVCLVAEDSMQCLVEGHNILSAALDLEVYLRMVRLRNVCSSAAALNSESIFTNEAYVTGIAETTELHMFHGNWPKT